jgi:hypothetical protein
LELRSGLVETFVCLREKREAIAVGESKESTGDKEWMSRKEWKGRRRPGVQMRELLKEMRQKSRKKIQRYPRAKAWIHISTLARGAANFIAAKEDHFPQASS